ncbi:MAG: phosphatidate cytidylyltransferase [Phycisphaerales bacterium]|nr:phosphatidate cytidylyltransferase [Phycisphaerales bacterium]MCI0675239.1 phosphatidate cytidylyltransferase [Phycisphaerales bacterium]
MKYRLITGPLLLALLLGVILLDNWLETAPLSNWPWLQRLFHGKPYLPRGIVLYLFATFVVMPFAARELSAIFRLQGIATRRTLTTVAAMLGVTLSYVIPAGTDAVTAIALMSTGMILVFVGALLTFSQNRNVEGVVAAAGAVMFAMVYLGLTMGLYLALRRSHSAWWIVGIVVTTKACDTGAYFTGKAIGRHKLIPWLSPGKTWEGLVGGVLAAIAAGLVLAWLSQALLAGRDQVPFETAWWWAAIFALVGQFGDLMKSLLKRGAGIKDSSSLLPGLGGVLDVLDSPLMVAPVAYWLIMLSGPY